VSPRRPVRVDAALLRRWPLPPTDGDAGKDERGRVLVVGGSREVPGAILLAGTAALRAGAGKLQMASARDAAVGLGIAMPEARVLPLDVDREGEIDGSSDSLRKACAHADALLIGPGMAFRPQVRELVQDLTRATTATMVLDAGGLAGWDCTNPGGPRVLSPHAGEMATMLGCPREEVAAHPEACARAIASAQGAVVVLKGADTWIAGSDGQSTWLHRAARPGLGTSGSGDVLSGLITGLLARGAAPEQAAAWGVFVHAQAGAAAARRLAAIGYLAGELCESVPRLIHAASRSARHAASGRRP